VRNAPFTTLHSHKQLIHFSSLLVSWETTILRRKYRSPTI